MSDSNLMSEEDDSGPEEIDVKTSKNSMFEAFDNQKKAIRDYNEFNKIKRKQINDKYVEQKTKKQIGFKTIEKLSENVLNDINFDTKEESKTKDLSKGNQPIVEKRPKKKIKKSYEFNTQSTHFDVLDVNKDLPNLIQIKANSKNNAINFKDNLIFDKRRNKRLSSSKIRSNFVKQHFNRK